jgi:lipopolysaccharide transport system permease protein
MAGYTQGTYQQNITFREEWQRNLGLLGALLARDFKARYRRSHLGFLWNFLQPLLQLVVYIILRSIFKISTGDTPFAIFLLSTLIPWNYFVRVASGSPAQILSNVGIFRKVNVPRELFLVNGAIINMVEILIGFLFLAVLMAIYSIPLTWNILWLPILLFFLIMLSLGLGMWLTAVGVYKADILVFITPVFQVWFFVTPIFYPISLVPKDYLFWYQLNPMVGIITGFRNVITLGEAPDFGTLGISLIGLLVLWVIAWPLFRRVSPYFADVL